MEDSQNIIVEHEAKKEDPIFRCVRSFYLPVCDGPQIAVPKDALVRLKPETAQGHFEVGRIEPVGLPDRAQYEVMHEIRTLSPEGTYLTLYRGDKVEMSWPEAWPLLRERTIKPINFNLFTGGVQNATESDQKLLAKK